MADTITFFAQFTASKVGKTGLTPTVDVKRVKRSDGTQSAVVTGGSATELSTGRGGYFYRLTSADITQYDYYATFITADSTVDAKEVPSAFQQYSPQANVVSIIGDAQAATSWYDLATYYYYNNKLPQVVSVFNDVPVNFSNWGYSGIGIEDAIFRNFLQTQHVSFNGSQIRGIFTDVSGGLHTYVIRNAAGQFYRNDGSFEDVNYTNWSFYARLLSDDAAGVRSATFPYLPDGIYTLVFYFGSVTSDDKRIGIFTVQWKDGQLSYYGSVPANTDPVAVNAEDIRNALATPATIAPQAGSIDNLLLTIKGQWGTVQPISPITDGGQSLQLITGDDYDSDTAQPLEWADPGNWPTLEGGTVTLSLRRNGETGNTFTLAGQIVAEPNTPQRISFAVTGDQTAALAIGKNQYRFDLRAHLASDKHVTLLIGRVSVVESLNGET